MCEWFGGASGCGADGYFEGSFRFEEWGIGDPFTLDGYNHGLLSIYTADGEAKIRFDGQTAVPIVSGSFDLLDGHDVYKHLKGQGSFAGNAGLAFSVGYDPCGKHTSVECAAGVCFVRGGELSFHKTRVRWPLTNYGGAPITLDQIRIFWPEVNGALTEVRLGKSIFKGQLPPAYWDSTDDGWLGHDSDRRINQYQTRDLMFEFENDAGTAPHDYTVVVEFAEGCATTAIAFDGEPPELLPIP